MVVCGMYGVGYGCGCGSGGGSSGCRDTKTHHFESFSLH